VPALPPAPACAFAPAAPPVLVPACVLEPLVPVEPPAVGEPPVVDEPPALAPAWPLPPLGLVASSEPQPSAKHNNEADTMKTGELIGAAYTWRPLRRSPPHDGLQKLGSAHQQ
jgi:hypothetical protein